MKKTAIIRKIAAVFAVVSILGAGTACTSKKTDRESDKDRNTRNEETERAGKRTTGAENTVLMPPEEPTETTLQVKPITDDSIFIRLDGMTAEEIIDNLWKTTNLHADMYSAEFYENIVLDGCTLFTKKDDDFSWNFYEASSDTTRYISRISVFSGFTCEPTFDGDGDIVLEIHVDDPDFAFEVAEKIVEKIQEAGFSIDVDMKSSEENWYVGLRKDMKSSTLQLHHIGDYVITFDMPVGEY